MRELLCDAMLVGKEYGSDLASLDRYFYTFVLHVCNRCTSRPLILPVTF